MSLVDFTPYRSLKERDLAREGLFVAEGRFLVERALASSWEILSLLCLPSLEEEFRRLIARRPSERRCPLGVLPKAELQEIAGFPFHRGVLAAGIRPAGLDSLEPPPWLSGARRILVGSSLSDPFNIGGLLRSAAALGWDGLILADHCADPLTRGGLRASMGAGFSFPLWQPRAGDPLEAARRMGFALAGTVLQEEGSVPLSDFEAPEKLLLLVGNEGLGLSRERRAACDQLVTIPMAKEIDSLNVGVAAGIFLHALSLKE